MNKWGFISSILTLVLFLLQFIPLGIYFGSEGNLSIWLGPFYGIDKNPWINSFVKIPLELFIYQNKQIFIWGIKTEGSIQLWFDIHLITFIFLFILTLLTGVLALIGCGKDTKGGKKLIIFNFYAVLLIFLYSTIGFTFYSEDIFGIQMEYLDIILSTHTYFSFGFYILLIDLIIALIAYIKHPIKLY